MASIRISVAIGIFSNLRRNTPLDFALHIALRTLAGAVLTETLFAHSDLGKMLIWIYAEAGHGHDLRLHTWIHNRQDYNKAATMM